MNFEATLNTKKKKTLIPLNSSLPLTFSHFPSPLSHSLTHDHSLKISPLPHCLSSLSLNLSISRSQFLHLLISISVLSSLTLTQVLSSLRYFAFSLTLQSPLYSHMLYYSFYIYPSIYIYYLIFLILFFYISCNVEAWVDHLISYLVIIYLSIYL